MNRLFLASLACLLAPAAVAAQTITGSVTYLQRMMLPPDAVVEIAFEDVSLADAPARTLAVYRIPEPQAPPYPFAFAYTPSQIDPANRYGLRATVRVGEKLLMTTDTAYPVLTHDGGTEVEMLLKMVSSPDPTPPPPDADFVNTYWKLLTLAGAPVPVVEGKREAHLILHEDGSYTATVGCNMLRGGYELSGDTVAFLAGITTLMACPPPLDAQERALVSLLETATRPAISGDDMTLLDDEGETLATFRAVYF
ncbi:YbaY family lipoprotein [Tropicimonas isoalkanivorans]|uniref:Putative lipoprotein n=1 Tax=Tropicimonas isoalkanivorans TaxID=441112 RepID=A0A1I1JLA9_9RHOB|nr:YbaY family lipoprotein [Tropicimonas isoalkanivorans]SFC49357.1 putative lipoprotein [Tropicimonas isoalkanivorans]